MAEHNLETHFVEHLIDAARLKTEVENLKSAQADIQARMLTELSSISVKLDGLAGTMQGVPERISVCRAEIRREVERDFPNRTDAIEMEHRIEKKVEEGDRELATKIGDLSTKFVTLESKVDKMWLKISVAVSVIGTVLVLLGWVLDRLPILMPIMRSTTGG